MKIFHMDGRVIYEDLNCSTMRELVEKAVENGADLKGSDLRYADLKYADLRGTDLRDADLRYAVLRYAVLKGSDLRGAYLKGSDLRGAYLKGSDLRGSDLRDADLRYADLRGTDLRDAKLPDFQIFPEEGSFIAWKKCIDNVILKIEIPEDAQKTSTLVSRKCRASKVKVLQGWDSQGKELEKGIQVENWRQEGFFYTIGETIESDYDDDIRVECTRGIHFFMTRKEAEEF